EVNPVIFKEEINLTEEEEAEAEAKEKADTTMALDQLVQYVERLVTQQTYIITGSEQ
ncbi:hypothetical protein Ddye_003088, partial [Dipteronia dyeriana]